MSQDQKQPTQEALEKAASVGFVSALKQAGKSDEEIKTMHDAYVAQRTNRGAKYAKVEEAIIAGAKAQ
jgi:hypothetical protein